MLFSIQSVANIPTLICVIASHFVLKGELYLRQLSFQVNSIYLKCSVATAIYPCIAALKVY